MHALWSDEEEMVAKRVLAVQSDTRSKRLALRSWAVRDSYVDIAGDEVIERVGRVAENPGDEKGLGDVPTLHAVSDKLVRKSADESSLAGAAIADTKSNVLGVGKTAVIDRCRWFALLLVI